jgi:hypothetical protein
MVESKVIALWSRLYVQERDMVDLFLFRDHLARDCQQRLKTKLSQLSLSQSMVAERIGNMLAHRDRHVRSISEILDEQFDENVAANIRLAGGAAMVFDQVMSFLKDRCAATGGSSKP